MCQFTFWFSQLDHIVFEDNSHYRVLAVKRLLSLFKICSIFLFILVVLIGWSQIPLYLHLEAEKDNPAHNSQTCPQCQQLKSITSVLFKAIVGANAFSLEDDGTPILCMAPVLQSHWAHHAVSRAPPII